MRYLSIGELAMQTIVSEQFQKVSPRLWEVIPVAQISGLAWWQRYFICGGSKTCETWSVDTWSTMQVLNLVRLLTDSSHLGTFLPLSKSSSPCHWRKLGCFDVICSFYGVFFPHFLGAWKCHASKQKYTLIIQIMASTAYHTKPPYSLFFS